MSKKFTIKNYKGNLLESISKFQASHKNMRIVEAIEDGIGLNISAEPVSTNPYDSTTQNSEEFSKSNELESIFNFGSKVLMFGIEVHLWHLNCSRNAQHLALKDLYEACDDIGDRLLEAAIGIAGGNATISATSPDIDIGNFDDKSIEKIISMKSEAAMLVGQFDPGIDNILSDFVETCNSVIYKLKRLS